MPTFLSLPRELRDEIYNYVLISPSGLIAPHTGALYTKLKPSRRRQLNTKTKLHLLDPSSPHTHELDNKSRIRSWQTRCVSLSLPRTCRQIYNETRGLFWKQNTFYFDGFHESEHGLGIVRTLKVIGQTASRLIEQITIRMPLLGAEYSALRKVLSTLSSRARHGNFRRLELVWGAEEFNALIFGMVSGEGHFDGMLVGFRAGIEGERFERVVRVPEGWGLEAGGQGEVFTEIVKLMHLAIGGTMICGNVVRWENYAMVKNT